MKTRCRSGFWQLLALITLLASLTLGLARPGVGQSPGGINLAAQAGFDGVCKDANWIPLRVRVENQGPDFEGRLEARLVGVPDRQTIYAQTISLSNPSRKEVSLAIYPEGFLGTMDVALVAQGKTAAQNTLKLNCLSVNDAIYGVLAASPSAFGSLGDLDPPSGRATVAQLGLADLPEQAQALGMLDALVISGVDTGALTPGQRQALAGWVAAGGQLIIAGGPDWQKTAAGLGNLLPLAPGGVQTLSSLDPIAAYAGSSAGLPGQVPVVQGSLAPDAQVLVAQAGFPLVIARTVGYGRVFYLAADPAIEPLKSWGDNLAFYRKLLSGEPPRPAWAGGFWNWPLASNAVTSLPGLKLPPVGLVIGLLAVYVLAIGPLNYLLLRLLKRRELAWLSIPVLVIVFSGLAFLAGNQARGNRPVLNRLAIVQVWPGAAQAQVDGLFGIFSPSRVTYQAQIGPGFLAHPFLENDSLAQRGGWVFLRQETGGTTLPDLHLDVAGMNAVVLAGQIKAPEFSSSLALALDSQGITVRGSLTNGSLALKDAVLLSMGSAKHLGDLQPGETRDLQYATSLPGRAAQAGRLSTGTSIKAVPAQPAPGPAPFAIQGIPYTNTLVANLLGTTDYYRDQETFRRYALLSAAAGDGGSLQGAGIYLAGWSSDSPLPAGLSTSPVETSNTTLYLVALNPAVSVQAGRLELPPGLFTWSTLEGPVQSSASPYDSFLPQGASSFRYQLSLPVPYRTVTGLTLHLRNYGAIGPSGLRVSLWDFTAQQWAALPALDWGDVAVPEPNQYVGPSGETRLRLENLSSTAATFIEAADVSLSVEP